MNELIIMPQFRNAIESFNEAKLYNELDKGQNATKAGQNTRAVYSDHINIIRSPHETAEKLEKGFMARLQTHF